MAGGVRCSRCPPADSPEPPAPNVGTNSNWLRACSADEQCGDLPACHCGACTVECDRQRLRRARRRALRRRGHRPSRRRRRARRSRSLPQAGICLPRCAPGGCDDGQACVAEACVLAPLPDVPFCDPVATQPRSAARARGGTARAAAGAAHGRAARSARRARRQLPRAGADLRRRGWSCAARVWAARARADRHPVRDRCGGSHRRRSAAGCGRRARAVGRQLRARGR